MSFTDFDVNDFIAQEARRSTMALADAQETNPDEAARARQLAEATGADPVLVLGDLKNFEQQHKLGLGVSITDENEFIANYLRSNELAAKISSDDLGQLDATSEKLQKFRKFDITTAAIKAFNAGFDWEGRAKEWEKLDQQAPGFRSVASMLPGVNMAWAGVQGFDAFVRGGTGLIYGAAAAIAETLKSAGMPEAQANRLMRDIVIGAQVAMPEVIPELGRLSAMPRSPWVKEGKAPPVGVDPVLDVMRTQQVILDVDNLAEAVAEAAKSATRERSPDMFADFVREHNDGDVYVSADKVAELYGDKPPSPDDNILGWVPRLSEQLATAQATGGDIAIPVADLMARIDRSVFNEIKNHVRTRPDGVTIEESKLPPVPSEPEVEAIKAPAVMAKDGTIFTDVNHGLAADRAIAAGYDIGNFLDSNGFVTSTGRFVDRIEAHAVANKASQINQEKLGMGNALTAHQVQGFEQPPLTPRQYVEDYIAGKANTLAHKEYARHRQEQIKAEFTKQGLHPDPTLTNAVQDMRKAGGFTPAQGRKATLERAESPFVPPAMAGKAPTHKFNVKDDKGNVVADILLAEEDGGKRLYVDDISAVDAEGTARPIAEAVNTLGPRAIRDILEQVKELFPNAEMLEGMRVSGAREKAGILDQPGSKAIEAGLDLTKVKPRRKPEQLEMTELTRMEDREAFEKGAAIGMTADQYKRFQKLIEKQLAEDQAYYTKKAVAEAKKRQTAEWKANEQIVRQEVAAEFRQRPDIAADEFFRDGKLLDETLATKPKIAEEFLTEEQKAALPKSYYGKKGMHPDEAATLLGYDSGAQMLTELTAFNIARAATNMRPMDYTRRLVSAETERRMVERHGSLSDNIIEEAKERVLSETQIEMLHEETLARATEAGLEFSIKKDQLVSAIKEHFEEATVKEAKSDKLFADAGRANKQAEMALLKGDYAEAFRQKQRAYIATVMAREAFGVEQLRAKLDKTAERFGKREVKGIEQESTNYIQRLLSEAGYTTKLTPEEINRSIEFQGAGSLADYVRAKDDFGWTPAVSDQLQEFGAKPLDSMTIAEFREFKDAIDSLVHIGREEKKINIAGEKMEFDAFKATVIDNLKSLPARPREKQGRWFFELDASLTNMEQIIKDLDLRQELGPMFRAVIEPMMASKAKEFDLRQDLSNYFKGIKHDFGRKWQKSLNDTIPNDFLIDPYTGALYDLTRENLIQLMLNWGNKSNIDKTARGYASLDLGRKATREEGAAYALRIKALIDSHATKQDWDFVTQMWHPFKEWQKMSDVVARNTSGVAPKWIEPQAIQTPFGEIDGGYWPVKYDRLGSNLAVIEDKKPSADALFGPTYFRAATAKGYLKERTGYIDAVDLNTSLEQAAGVMQQTMHDIAFRDALIQAGKVFYDKDIRAAIRKHYGSEYEAQLIPWLKRISHAEAGNERAVKFYNDWQRRIRTNLIGHALPLNLKVILSPDVGVPNPKQWAAFEANRAENVKLAMEKSNEIRHLVYNMDRDYRAQLEKLSIHPGLMSETQRKAIEWGFKPMMTVSQEFRMSTFVDQYNKARGRGLSEHEASVLADSFVRERHGAASVVDLPAVMNQSETMKTLTTFYGFFSTMYNWQRQLPGNVRRKEVKNFSVNALGSIITGATFGALLFNKSDPDESWFKKIGKALLLQPLQTVPIVREAANYFIEGYSPRSPTEGLITALSGAITEGKRVWEGKAPKRPIQAGANVIGLTTGLPLAQIGRTAQFSWDVYAGKQRPKNIVEWMRGIIHGEAQPRR